MNKIKRQTHTSNKTKKKFKTNILLIPKIYSNIDKQTMHLFLFVCSNIAYIKTKNIYALCSFAFKTVYFPQKRKKNKKYKNY